MCEEKIILVQLKEVAAMGERINFKCVLKVREIFFKGWGKNDGKSLAECYMAIPGKILHRVLCSFLVTILSLEH